MLLAAVEATELVSTAVRVVEGIGRVEETLRDIDVELATAVANQTTKTSEVKRAGIASEVAQRDQCGSARWIARLRECEAGHRQKWLK